ncbi:MAG: GldG family protein [Acidiferrobacterales bacterium]|nr:GldG family protein [Acidiferrobacterales bacterium]
MKLTSRSVKQMQFAGASFVLLVLVVGGLVLWLSKLYYWETDLTLSGRNSLSDASIKVLQQMDKPLKITAYASLHGDRRVDIKKLIDSYRRYKRDIDLEFVDPNSSPQKTRAAGIQYDGQLVLEYNGSHKLLTQLKEEALTNALVQLGHKNDRWVLFLTGHGERSIERQANFDLSDWAQHLHKQGFLTRSLSLSETPSVPTNTSVLVIAGPQSDLLPGEVKEIEKYVNAGGHLLWLHDPGKTYGLAPIMEDLDIEFQPGIIIDPLSQLLTGSATAIVIGKYGSHPIVKNFNDNTVFPNACGIEMHKSKKWKQSVLLDTREQAWSETGRLGGKVKRDKGIDIPGPLNVGVALTRDTDKGEQRIVVMCDGDFLSNTFLGNAGNLELGMSIANWLSHDDAYINIPTVTAADAKLDLSVATKNVMTIIFALIMPLALIGTGLTIWFRRRRR